MQYRIKRFGVHSTALTVAILYFLLALVFMPILWLASRGAAGTSLPGLVILFVPLMYAVVGYVFTAIGCWLYNIVSGWVGGIALTLEPDEAGA